MPVAAHALVVGPRAEQRVVVDRRDAEEGEQDAVRRQRLGRDDDRVVSDLLGRGERVEVVDVELVDRLAPARRRRHRDPAAVGQRPLDQRLPVGVVEDALGRPQPDAVVAGQEVEPGGRPADRADPAGPRARVVVSPETKECSTSGGSANW